MPEGSRTQNNCFTCVRCRYCFGLTTQVEYQRMWRGALRRNSPPSRGQASCGSVHSSVAHSNWHNKVGETTRNYAVVYRYMWKFFLGGIWWEVRHSPHRVYTGGVTYPDGMFHLFTVFLLLRVNYASWGNCGISFMQAEFDEKCATPLIVFMPEGVTYPERLTSCSHSVYCLDAHTTSWV